MGPRGGEGGVPWYHGTHGTMPPGYTTVPYHQPHAAAPPARHAGGLPARLRGKLADASLVDR